MTEPPEGLHVRAQELSNKFFEDVQKRGASYFEQAFAYEKLAIEYSQKGFQTLTYLNSGAPAALAFLKAEVPASSIIAVAASFVVGLLAVVLAQVMAFFTMAKRSESAQLKFLEQYHRVAALAAPLGSDQRRSSESESAANRTQAIKRSDASNFYRFVGLAIYAVSMLAFVLGCLLGAAAVLAAKSSL